MQKILKIDLSRRKTSSMVIPEEWEREYLGGASLAARLLYESLTPRLDPLSPEAPLLILNGPLSGTSGPAVGRTVICARSPATRLWGESNIGGFWGSELRAAGYDGLWIEGRASEPVYISIDSEKVEFLPAFHLWGDDTYQTIEAVESELEAKKVRVAAIGPAGETLIPFALILSDHGRVAGRTGMGAVMGSKYLKAIAVHGSEKIPLADETSYKQLRTQANQALRDDPVTIVARELGTASVADYYDYLGEMPKRYFQDGSSFEELQITGTAVANSILVGVKACHACVIACGRVVRLLDGVKRKGPEYETLVGFGPNLGLNDPVVATRMGELCDRYGIDSISTSNVIGLAFRLFEMGKINEDDTGGLKLAWGDAQAVETLIHLIVQHRDFGEHLASGSLALARRYEAEDEAVQVNGLEAAYHDPRGFSGNALVYATSPRGACHNQSDYFLAETGQLHTCLGMENFHPLGGAEKAVNVAVHQDWRTACNAMILCYFSNIPPASAVELINAACGYDWSIDDLMRSGERGWNLKRMINTRFGLSRVNDRLPKAMLRPYSDGVNDNFVPDLESMLAAYYRARDWDPVTGVPNASKLHELDLDFCNNK